MYEHLTARDIVETLDLAPQPEGGWYRETWRADAAPGERVTFAPTLASLQNELSDNLRFFNKAT